MIDNGINNSYYSKRFIGKVRLPKIRRRGDLVIIDKPRERDIDIYYTTNGDNPTINDIRLVGNVINISNIDVLKIVSVQKRKLHTPIYSDIYTININPQKIYVPSTINGDDNPVLEEEVYYAYYVLKNTTQNRSVKLILEDVEVESGVSVSDTLTTITAQIVEEIPELADYVGWYLDIVTINASSLEDGSYSIEYTADNLTNDRLTFKVADEEVDYLCFTAQEDDAKLSFIGSRTSDKIFDLPDLKYSTDKKNWTALTYTEGEESEGYIHFSSQIFTLGLGDKVYFKGLNPNGFSRYNKETESELYCSFNISEGAIAASGDIGTITNEIGGADCVLTKGCYVDMFTYCTSLTSAPELPATTLAEGCYGGMFYGCTSLTSAPSLPATTLIGYCYNSMFEGCSSLTEAPALPATTLVESCYSRMFMDCTFPMSNDGTTFNFSFGAALPQTVGETTFSTHKDVAELMCNTTGFNEQTE